MLCHICSTIDFDALFHEESVKHHGTLSALRESAALGCKLCASITKGIADITAEGDPFAPIIITGSVTNADYLGKKFFLLFRVESDINNGRLAGHRYDVSLDREAHVETTKPHLLSFPNKSHRSEDCYVLSREWICDCLRDHSGLCSDFTATSAFPTRLLDVGINGSSTLRVVHKSEGDSGQWVALSHTWGSTPPFTSTKATISNRQLGIEISALPATFQDAVFVTRKLGYQYLWIDSLCILQDSVEDWNSEALRMSLYYGNAVVTIAASFARSHHDGFLDKRHLPEFRIKVPLNSNLYKGHNYFYVTEGGGPNTLSDDLHIGPLHTRAWTLQERLLSRRVIHFGWDQLSFECSKGVIEESSSHLTVDQESLSVLDLYSRPFLLANFNDTTDSTKLVTGVWSRIVQDYCSRSLSVQSDIFPAISGIARRIAEKTGYTYRAGIWLEAVVPLLLWQVYPSARSSRHRTTNFLAPSWSWASLPAVEPAPDHPLFYSNQICYSLSICYDRLLGQEPKLVSCTTELATADEFGSLKSGVIVLRGKLLDFGIQSLQHWSRSERLSYYNEGLAEIEWDEPMQDYRSMFFLCMGRWKYATSWADRDGPGVVRFLVLRRVDKKDGIFKRVGVGYYRLKSELDKCSWVETTVSII